MIHIGRAIRPLIGARQRRSAISLAKAKGCDGVRLHLLGKRLKFRRRLSPVVERRLQCRRNVVGERGAGEIARDDGEPAVTAALQRC